MATAVGSQSRRRGLQTPALTVNYTYIYIIKNNEFHIDFQRLAKSFGISVRERAAKANSTIVYKSGNFLIEENPRTGEKKILKEYSSAAS